MEVHAYGISEEDRKPMNCSQSLNHAPTPVQAPRKPEASPLATYPADDGPLTQTQIQAIEVDAKAQLPHGAVLSREVLFPQFSPSMMGTERSLPTAAGDGHTSIRSGTQRASVAS